MLTAKNKSGKSTAEVTKFSNMWGGNAYQNDLHKNRENDDEDAGADDDNY